MRWEETAIVNAARQVTVIAWLDSTNVFAVQGHSRAAEFLESGDLLLHNTSNLPALGWGGLHVYDHSQPNVRAIWRNNCLALTAAVRLFSRESPSRRCSRRGSRDV